jgi:ParB family chromosome partitioning protein
MAERDDAQVPAEPVGPLPVAVPLALVDVSRWNTRHDLDAGGEDASLYDLAENIRRKGLLSPPLVRPAAGGRYEVVAGQRRVLACRRLGLATIHVVVREELTDLEAVALSLTENVHRAEVHPMDKARAFGLLLEQTGTPAALSRELGLPAATIRKYDRLNRLPLSLQVQIGTRQGPAGVEAMSQLAASFPDPAEAEAAYELVQGFTGATARRLLQRSGGDLHVLSELADDAVEEEFGRPACGTCLETCPFLPPGTAGAVQALLTKLGSRALPPG